MERSDQNTITDIPLSELNAHDEKDLLPPVGMGEGLPSEPVPATAEAAAGAEPADDEYPSGLRLAFILIGCVLAMFLTNLDMTIIATAIPRITDEFHSLDDIGWYGSAFFLTIASFQSTWGKVFKYFPLKLGVLGAIAIFELGSLICALAPNSTALIIGRAISGVGAGGIVAGDFTIIAFSAPLRRRPVYSGLLGVTYGVAAVVGPLLGGVFTDKLTWRWCFYINLPIGGFAAVMIFVFFHPPAAAAPVKATALEKFLQMDMLGTVAVMAAVCCYLLSLQWGGITVPWNDSKVYGLLIGFGLLSIVFAVNEWRMGERAAVMPRLLKQRTVLVACLYCFFLQGGFFLLVYYIPIYFQSIDNVSASESGVRNLPLILAVAIFQLVTGFLMRITGHYVPILHIGGVLATVGGGMLYTLDLDSGAGKWIGYQILVGAGFGIGIQIPVPVAQSKVAPTDLGPLTATVLFFSCAGGAMFVSAGNAIFSNQLIHSLATTVPSVDPALVISAGATGLRQVFSPDVVPGIIAAYMQGIKAAFALGLASLGIATVVGFFIEWGTFKDGPPVTETA